MDLKKPKTYSTQLVVILFVASNIFSFAQKIPITSKSTEAIEIYKQGWQLENTLKIDEAELAYKKAISLDSTFALAHFRLGMVRDNYNLRRQKLNDVLKYINQVSEGERLLIKARVDFYASGYDGSNEYNYFKTLVRLHPNDEVANYLFGFVNLHHGGKDTEKAIYYYKKAIEINPNYTAPYNELAYVYMTNNDFENAKVIAERYVSLLPNSVNPLDTYAEIFMRSGQYQESIDKYLKVLKIDNTYPWAIMGITANLNFLDKHSEARIFLGKLNESKLSDYEYRHKWRSLVVSYLDEGDYEGAINSLEEQKQESLSGLNEHEPLFHIYYAFLRKTRLLFESKQADKGLKEYEKWNDYVQQNYTRETTKNRVSHLKNYYLAYAEYLNANYVNANMYLDTYESTKINDQSKILRSKIYRAQGKRGKAIELLKTTDLTDPYSQYVLAIYLSEGGERKEAKALTSKIIALNERNNINLALVRKRTKMMKL